MIALKIVGCILIISSCAGTGFLLASELQRRLEDLKAAKSMAILLRGDIRYAQTALPEALENAARRHEGRLAPFLKRVSGELKQYSGTSLKEIWRKAVKEELSHTALSKKDKECLVQLGDHLGYLDKDMQMNTIDWYITQVDEIMKDITAESKQKMRLYQSLGVLFGLFVIILIL